MVGYICCNSVPNSNTQKVVFVCPNIRKGIIPEVLSSLINTRIEVKHQSLQEKDPQIKAILDGRQLALKVSLHLSRQLILKLEVK